MIKKSRNYYQILIFFTKFCQIRINQFNGLNFLLFIRLWMIKPCIKLNFKCTNNAATTHVNGVDFWCTFYDQSSNSFSISGYKFCFKRFLQLLFFVHTIFSSFGFWYFGHFSCVIFFPFFPVLPYKILTKITCYCCIFVTSSPKVTKNQKRKMG